MKCYKVTLYDGMRNFRQVFVWAYSETEALNKCRERCIALGYAMPYHLISMEMSLI